VTKESKKKKKEKGIRLRPENIRDYAVTKERKKKIRKYGIK
jgi:hypothetical protein